MEDELRNVHNDFLISAPRKIVSDIFNDDKKNYKEMESELSKEVVLLDDALILFITSLQGVYRSLNEWKDNISLKAAVSMANSALNYLFYADMNEAQKFLSGKKLCKVSEQSYVDNKVATILKY